MLKRTLPQNLKILYCLLNLFFGLNVLASDSELSGKNHLAPVSQKMTTNLPDVALNVESILKELDQIEISIYRHSPPGIESYEISRQVSASNGIQIKDIAKKYRELVQSLFDLDWIACLNYLTKKLVFNRYPVKKKIVCGDYQKNMPDQFYIFHLNHFRHRRNYNVLSAF